MPEYTLAGVSFTWRAGSPANQHSIGQNLPVIFFINVDKNDKSEDKTIKKNGIKTKSRRNHHGTARERREPVEKGHGTGDKSV